MSKVKVNSKYYNFIYFQSPSNLIEYLFINAPDNNYGKIQMILSAAISFSWNAWSAMACFGLAALSLPLSKTSEGFRRQEDQE
jgi:hypothetical protein